MNLMAMSFKGRCWRVNPTALKVEYAENIRETLLPFVGSRLTDLGQKKRRASGEGYFVGGDCMEQWRRLEGLFMEGGPGSLLLPGMEPMRAVLSELRLLGEEGAGLVKYSFVFTETWAGESYRGQGVHRAAQGESLWDYAGRYGWDMEELRAANTHIRDIACLEQGEEVYAP
ncbi:LysM peptidoglycan-binding domain-containing protein [Acutalibacter muris]|mgnify:FL=1|jgi:hypothetical protein|uniref:LysM peptidoglycan-binding domain-containing protein n=1 Tax=Acutalibacter muris TaxID=1796620 RepID=UPI0026F387C6|nr:DNA circularization N-terminal domain-containing protein [Acutalibacter muris]MCI9191921.1 LysM peptidoglycan-binding domain-containing protein [Acutalibacter muris]